MKKYKNRYGDEWYLEKISKSEYLFVMQGDSMKYCRFGGKKDQQDINMNDLGFFDPSGGPFISIGSVIDGLTVEKISSTLQGIVLTMRKEKE